jgi:peptide/nickel transport system permease protein
MAVSTGTEQVTAGKRVPRAPLARVARRRQRALRFPRSPKVIAGLAILVFFVLLAIIGPLVAPYSPNAIFANSPVPLPPSGAHWLGTTNLQQDVFSQLLVGGGDMLLVAFIAGLIATALSVVIGVAAGYLGGLADDLLSMLANIFLVMPALPLLVILFGFLGKTGSNDLFLIGLIISITGWAWGARVLRAQTLSLRNRDYVDSARIIGERRSRIIFAEILPNLTPLVATSFLFTVLYAVGTYTAMAFLGLVNPNWNWGGMLFYAQGANAELTGYWWWFIPPGLAVALLGTSLVLLNFGIDEFVNPRLRAAGLSRRSGGRRRGGRSMRSQQFALTPVIRTVPVRGATPGTPAAPAEGAALATPAAQAQPAAPGTPAAQAPAASAATLSRAARRARGMTPGTPVEEGQA